MNRNIKTAIYLAILCALFLLWIKGIGWIMLAIRFNIDLDSLRWVILIPSIAIYFGFTVVLFYKAMVFASKKLGL